MHMQMNTHGQVSAGSGCAECYEGRVEKTVGWKAQTRLDRGKLPKVEKELNV